MSRLKTDGRTTDSSGNLSTVVMTQYTSSEFRRNYVPLWVPVTVGQVIYIGDA